MLLLKQFYNKTSERLKVFCLSYWLAEIYKKEEQLGAQKAS